MFTTPKNGTPNECELNAEGVNKATGISIESRSKEPGLPLGQPDPWLVAGPPTLPQPVISCTAVHVVCRSRFATPG